MQIVALPIKTPWGLLLQAICLLPLKCKTRTKSIEWRFFCLGFGGYGLKCFLLFCAVCNAKDPHLLYFTLFLRAGEGCLWAPEQEMRWRLPGTIFLLTRNTQGTLCGDQVSDCDEIHLLRIYSVAHKPQALGLFIRYDATPSLKARCIGMCFVLFNTAPLLTVL